MRCWVALTILLFVHRISGAGTVDQSHPAFDSGVLADLGTIEGVEVTAIASPGTFVRRDFRGMIGLGVSGGIANLEIGPEESITFLFAEPVRISTIRVCFLYSAGSFASDTEDEMAQFDVVLADGTPAVHTLSVLDESVAAFSGHGSVTNDSPANNAGAGAWTMQGASLFGGGEGIMALTLSASEIPANSDLDFRSLTFEPVTPPCPGDVDADGDTDVFDFGVLATYFGQSVPPGTQGDLDGDADVDVFDFGIFAGGFGCVP